MKKIDFKMLAGVAASWGAALLLITGKTGIQGIQPLNELACFSLCFAMGFMFLISIRKDK